MSDHGRRLASRQSFVNLCEAAQVQGTAHVIRHTVRTWLAEIAACRMPRRISTQKMAEQGFVTS